MGTRGAVVGLALAVGLLGGCGLVEPTSSETTIDRALSLPRGSVTLEPLRGEVPGTVAPPAVQDGHVREPAGVDATYPRAQAYGDCDARLRDAILSAASSHGRTPFSQRVPGTMTTRWSAVLVRPEVLGVRLTTHDSGAPPRDTSVVVWCTRDPARPVGTSDAVRFPAWQAVVDALVQAGGSAVPTPGAGASGPDVGGIFDDLTFTSDGRLRLVVDAGKVADPRRGRLVATFTREATDAVLSDVGRSTRDEFTGR